METIGTDCLVKNSNIFECKICNYVASRKYNLEIHNNGIKHKNLVLKINEDEKLVKLSKTSKKYECESCEKQYTNKSGLWKHKKKCINEIGLADLKNDLANEKKQQQLVEYLLKENSEFKHMILEMAKNTCINVSHTTANSHNTTNNDNKTFNLNFFLNETCKDAMNISDFVSSIKVNLEELENTGRQGYIEGISNIILKRLNNLEHTFRPLHCSDSKREVFYIKDNNEWTKESDSKPILTKAIKVIANENIQQIKHWRDKYPDCTDSDSKKNNLYLKIVSNSMNGSTAEESIKNIDKIISNVAKEVIIDKTNL
jgi:hypothetical protein